MKPLSHIIKSGTLIFASLALFSACEKDLSNNQIQAVDYYQLSDQKGRPAINTVFVSAADKDVFNTTIPTDMNAAFQTKFQNRLLALNPAYTTNALGLDAATFTGVLVTDVLNVSTTKPTTFFDGTNVLTGRNLSDDVIDIELLLIFGGPTGASNPGLTSDNVDKNDKSFLGVMPYMANPW